MLMCQLDKKATKNMAFLGVNISLRAGRIAFVTVCFSLSD